MNCQFLEHQFEAVIAHVVQINDAHHVRKEVPSDCQPHTFIIVELYVDLHACTHMNDTKNPGIGHTQHTETLGMCTLLQNMMFPVLYQPLFQRCTCIMCQTPSSPPFLTVKLAVNCVAEKVCPFYFRKNTDQFMFHLFNCHFNGSHSADSFG